MIGLKIQICRFLKVAASLWMPPAYNSTPFGSSEIMQGSEKALRCFLQVSQGSSNLGLRGPLSQSISKYRSGRVPVSASQDSK